MKNEIADSRSIDKRNAQYLIEGLAIALGLDAETFERKVEEPRQIVNLRYLFHEPKKNHHTKTIAFLILLSFSPLLYIGLNEFAKTGFTHSLNVLLVFQIIAVVCTIIALAFLRYIKK